VIGREGERKGGREGGRNQEADDQPGQQRVPFPQLVDRHPRLLAPLSLLAWLLARHRRRCVEQSGRGKGELRQGEFEMMGNWKNRKCAVTSIAGMNARALGTGGGGQ